MSILLSDISMYLIMSRESFEALWKCVKHPWFFFNTKGWVIYLEPKWPLIWLEKTLNLEGPRLKIEDKQVQIFFIQPYLGLFREMIQFEKKYQMGWNHQLVYKHDFISYEFPRFPSWTFPRNLLGGWAPRTCKWWSDHPPFISHEVKGHVEGNNQPDP